MNWISVSDFGAVGDGSYNQAPAINQAISAARDRGGGTVTVPAGHYRCGTIRLESRVTLHLEPGASLIGSDDLRDYETRVWGHHCDITPWHLILAEDAEDVAIVGQGTIDGRGSAFWEPDRPSNWHFWTARKHRVSPMIELVRCRRVLVSDVRVTGSAGWSVHLHDCDDAVLRGLQIDNTLFGPNVDGIDLTGCHRVTISDCHIRTGDDAIALKTSEYSRSCEYITITNCVLETSCVALRVGYESRQDLRHIVASNLIVPNCSRVLDVRSIEGAVIEDIQVTGVTATTNSGWPAQRPLGLSLCRCDNVYVHQLIPEHPDYGKAKPVERAGAIRRVSLRDWDVLTDGRALVVADDGLEMCDLLFENLRFRYALMDDPGPFADSLGVGYIPGDHRDAREVHAAWVLKNVTRARLLGLSLEWPSGGPPGDWNLLRSPYAAWNKNLYIDRAEEVRARGTGLVFAPLWQKDCREVEISHCREWVRGGDSRPFPA